MSVRAFVNPSINLCWVRNDQNGYEMTKKGSKMTWVRIDQHIVISYPVYLGTKWPKWVRNDLGTKWLLLGTKWPKSRYEMTKVGTKWPGYEMTGNHLCNRWSEFQYVNGFETWECLLSTNTESIWYVPKIKYLDFLHVQSYANEPASWKADQTWTKIHSVLFKMMYHTCLSWIVTKLSNFDTLRALFAQQQSILIFNKIRWNWTCKSRGINSLYGVSGFPLIYLTFIAYFCQGHLLEKK